MCCTPVHISCSVCVCVCGQLIHMDLLPGDLMIPGPIKIKQLQDVDLYCCSLCPSITVFLSLSFFFSFLHITYYIFWSQLCHLLSLHPDTQIVLVSLSPPALGSRTVYPCVWNGLNGRIWVHSASPVDLSGWMSFGMNRRDTTQIRMTSLHVCVHLCLWTSLFMCI